MKFLAHSKITSWPFIGALMLLLANDFVLKYHFPGLITGKLSDISGLFVFIIFFRSILPERFKIELYVSIAILFLLWKSPFSQTFIEAFSRNFYSIDRVVDITDLLVLLLLPAYFRFETFEWKKISISPVLIGSIAIFAFCSTSIARPYLTFEYPQYLLLKYLKDGEQPRPDITTIIDSVNSDTLALQRFDGIPINKYPLIKDDYATNQVRDQLLWFALEELTKSHPVDSLKIDDFLVKGEKNIVFTTDSTIENLSFLNSRLNGSYSKFNLDGELLVTGFYNLGAPDSIWNYFTASGEVLKKEVFENRELASRSVYSSAPVQTESFLARRGKIKVLYAILIVMVTLMLGTIYWIYIGRNKSKNVYDFSWVFTIVYPVAVSALAFSLLLVIPYFTFTDFFPLSGILNLIIYFIISLLVYIVLLIIKPLRVKQFYIQYMLINAFVLCLYELIHFIFKLENEVLTLDF
jgi:hypothetical protein